MRACTHTTPTSYKLLTPRCATRWSYRRRISTFMRCGIGRKAGCEQAIEEAAALQICCVRSMNMVRLVSFPRVCVCVFVQVCMCVHATESVFTFKVTRVPPGSCEFSPIGTAACICEDKSSDALFKLSLKLGFAKLAKHFVTYKLRKLNTQFI